VSVRPDGIHQRGRAAVLAGRERLDVPPGPGSTRWGLSVDVRLDPAAEQHLDALATEAAAPAGPGQWLTGARGSSHLTVTYLERTWREVGPDDEAVRRYAALVAALAAGTPPLRWRLTGLALADRGVLAMAKPVDAAPGAFRAAVLQRLGGLGAEEAGYRGSTWWATLVHFAAPVADRAALVDWVDARVALPPLLATAERVEVVRYVYDGVRTAPVALSAAALPGVPEGAADGAHA
jgi:hypothetical protein